MDRCAALDWAKGDSDYVPCNSDQTEQFTLEGLMLTVEVHLCDAHRKYFQGKPKGWGLVRIKKSETVTGFSTRLSK